MRRSFHSFPYIYIMLLMASAACSKSADKDVWDNHDAQGHTYIDNDEYYIAPTGGYVNGASSGILDAD